MSGKNAARKAQAPVSVTSASSGNGHTSLSEDEIKRMVAEAAYFRAAQRGFAPGGELGDWLAAEREIEAFEGERRPDGAALGQELQHRALAETPPADATAR